MAQNNNQCALITGGSSGIGYELAKLFAQDGYNLILAARTTEDLEKVAQELSTQHNITATPITKDMFNPKAAFELYDEVKAKGITINVLVNNADKGNMDCLQNQTFTVSQTSFSSISLHLPH